MTLIQCLGLQPGFNAGGVAGMAGGDGSSDPVQTVSCFDSCVR